MNLDSKLPSPVQRRYVLLAGVFFAKRRLILIFKFQKRDETNALAEENTSQDEARVVRVEDGGRRLLEEGRPVRQGRRGPGRRRRQGEHHQSEQHA